MFIRPPTTDPQQVLKAGRNPPIQLHSSFYKHAKVVEVQWLQQILILRPGPMENGEALGGLADQVLRTTMRITQNTEIFEQEAEYFKDRLNKNPTTLCADVFYPCPLHGCALSDFEMEDVDVG